MDMRNPNTAESTNHYNRLGKVFVPAEPSQSGQTSRASPHRLTRLTPIMLFPTHIVVALPLIAVTDFSLFAVVFGCVVPDLVDKQMPRLNLTQFYHNVLHSGFSSIGIVALAVVYPPLAGLAVGWVTHIVMDCIHVVLNGRSNHLWFLAWPVKFDPDPLQLSSDSFFRHYVGTRSFYSEFVIWSVALYAGYLHFI
jgi:hypothetical protein